MIHRMSKLGIILIALSVAVAIGVGLLLRFIPQAKEEAQCRLSTKLTDEKGNFTTSFKNCPPIDGEPPSGIPQPTTVK